MGVYAYKALAGGGAAVRGTVSADTPRQARDNLRERGLVIEDLRPAASGRSAGWWSRLTLGRRRGGRRLTGFVRELATLLGVGIPLVEALATLARQYRGGFRSVILDLRERISAGGSLADAMRAHPQVFDPFCLHLVEVGENAGTLEQSLERLAEFKERSAQLGSRITTALFYPAVVLIMAVAVSLFLMSYVVPRLLEGLIQAGQEVPLATRIVKGASDLLLAWWWALGAGSIGVALLVAAVLRTHRGRLTFHRLLLKLPGVGELVRKQAVVRVAIVIATLLKSGVTFMEAVRIAGQSSSNLVLREALGQVERAVGSGRDIARALEATGAFRPTVVQVFAVGERSGRLEAMLERLAADYDRQVSTAAQRLAAVLEPILIVIMVVLVGLIAFATVLPMLEAGDVL